MQSLGSIAGLRPGEQYFPSFSAEDFSSACSLRLVTSFLQLSFRPVCNPVLDPDALLETQPDRSNGRSTVTLYLVNQFLFPAYTSPAMW